MFYSLLKGKHFGYSAQLVGLTITYTNILTTLKIYLRRKF